MLKIRVENGHYVIVRRDGNTERPIRDWKHHQAAAHLAVCQIARPPHVGLYDCPGWLVSVVGDRQ